jgi:hypothetical protein
MSGGSAVNVILDPILIFGLFGFPQLRLEGAALASVTSRATTFTEEGSRGLTNTFSGIDPAHIRAWQN